MSNEKDAARYAEGFVLVEGWIVTALADPAAPPSAAIVYLALGSFASTADGTCYPSRSTIATLANVSVDTVDRTLRYLAEVGAITIQRRTIEDGEKANRSSVYTLNRYKGGSRTAAATPSRTGAARVAAPARPRTRTNELERDYHPSVSSGTPAGEGEEGFTQLLEAIVQISLSQASRIRDRNAFATTIRTGYAPEAAEKWARWHVMFPEAPVELMAACIVDGSTRPLAPYYRSPDA